MMFVYLYAGFVLYLLLPHLIGAIINEIQERRKK